MAEQAGSTASTPLQPLGHATERRAWASIQEHQAQAADLTPAQIALRPCSGQASRSPDLGRGASQAGGEPSHASVKHEGQGRRSEVNTTGTNGTALGLTTCGGKEEAEGESWLRTQVAGWTTGPWAKTSGAV